MNGKQVCNRSNPEKTSRSYEGADFSWLSSKVSRTLIGVQIVFGVDLFSYQISKLVCHYF
jgi:hypothetical protein